MAKGAPLARKGIVVDSDSWWATRVRKGLEDALPEVMFQSFLDPLDAWNSIRSQEDLELGLLVTDIIGTIPLGRDLCQKVANKYPRARVVLFSDRATEQDIVDLQNRRRTVHWYVGKREGIPRVVEVAQVCWKEYVAEPVLEIMRLYLSQCKYPDAPFMAIENKRYSLVDLYREVVQKTVVGKEAEEIWRELLVRAVTLGLGQEEKS